MALRIKQKMPRIMATSMWSLYRRDARNTHSRGEPSAMLRFTPLVAALLILPNAALPATYKTPHTTFGAPDLQGIWTNSSLTMLERPPIFKALIATPSEAATMEAMFAKMVPDPLKPVDPNAPAPPAVKRVENSEWIEMDVHLARIDGNLRSSWIVEPEDGKLPFTAAGKAAKAAADKTSYDNPESRPLTERCLTAIGSPEGPPMMNTGYNANYKIVQTPDAVAIEVEMIHEVRVVRMTDRAHAPEAIRSWLGDSVGWYEGGTLVVETTNFDPRTNIDSLTGGFTYSPKGKLTERFTRLSDHEMMYEFSIDDPVHFTRPWVGRMPWRTASGPVYEYACHEGNYSLPLALSGARVQARAASEGANPPRPKTQVTPAPR